MNDLCCNHCGAPFSAEQVDRRLGVARCSHCNGLTDIADSALMHGRGEVPLPAGFRIQREGSRMRLTWRWFSMKHLFGLVMVFVPVAVVFGGDVIPSLDLTFIEKVSPPILWLILAAWIGGVYAALAKVINRSALTVDGQVIRVRHWPLLWFPMPTIPASELGQVYCKRREITRDKSVRIVYDVLGVLTNGSSRTLVANLERENQAEFIEQEIETALGIADQPVRGETA